MEADRSELDSPLDPALWIWVLIPIWVATLLMGLVRRNVAMLAAQEPRTDLHKVRDANRLKRSQALRAHAFSLPREQFQARRQYLAGPEGVLKIPKKDMSALTAIMNPESLANQVTAFVISIVPHLLLGTWARYMFSGMAVCRLPFTLSPRFRPMLQSGIELAGDSLDVRYVSALSWYVLSMFGNTGLLSIITRGDAEDMVMTPSVTSQIATNINPDKVFADERQALQKMAHQCKMSEAEDELLSVRPSEFADF